MISVFAPGALIATIFCFICWSILAARNLIDCRFWFASGCVIMCIGHCFAFTQYVQIFYIDKTTQTDKAMWDLFARMVCYCAAAFIFVTHYKYSFKTSERECD